MTDLAPSPRRLSGLLALVFAVTPVVAAAVIGNLATLPNLAPWYAGLVKPSFNPPKIGRAHV